MLSPVLGPAGWEYRNFPGHEPLLEEASLKLLSALRAGTFDTLGFLKDTRGAHQALFGIFVPEEHRYLAGHYRGEDFPELKEYMVTVRGGNNVGVRPSNVEFHIKRFKDRALGKVEMLDRLNKEGKVKRRKLLIRTVEIACDLCCRFTVGAHQNPPDSGADRA